jgi:cysteine-rich repeat protein
MLERRNRWIGTVLVPCALALCGMVAATAAHATFMCAGQGPSKGACSGGAPNGVCQIGEACDDGNTINGDNCDTNCTVPGCGNGVTGPGEECDAGAANDDVNVDATPPGNPCDTHCLLKQCGNHRLEGGELCDDGNAFNNDGCDSDPSTSPFPAVGLCLGSGCGNGITNMNEMMAGGCDDGNTVSGDGCSSTCVTEFCGDGISNDKPFETCDDGNTINTDHCSNTCVSSRCGDGIVQTSVEQCDDGNTVNTDACRNACTTSRCGDGISDTGEACDDGNTIDDATCLGDCSKVPVCGDAVTDATVEECDSGACVCVAPKKAANGKTCASLARRIACAADGGTCMNAVTHLPCGLVAGDGNIDDLPNFCRSLCVDPFCGDGTTDMGEFCDDGLVGAFPQGGDDTDSCPNGPMMIAMGMACQISNVCGDGVPNTDGGQFSCDNGNGTNPKTCLKSGVLCSVNVDCGTNGPCGNSDTAPDTCRTNCQPAHCGDGVTDSNESCDDGDTLDGPLCRSNCSLPTCGDKVVVAPETCDTGGSTLPGAANQPCTDTCRKAVCGDSKVCSASGCTSGPTGSGEECDDGNIAASDDCNDCRLNVCGDGVTRTSGTSPLEQCDDGNNANQDGCSGTCCFEPTAAVPGGLTGLFAAQQCTLDHLALDIASLSSPLTGSGAKRVKPTMSTRALNKLGMIQALARTATLTARDVSNKKSRKRVKTHEKRMGRLLIDVQRIMDMAYQHGEFFYPQYASISAQRVDANGYVNLVIDTMFNTP